VAAPEIPGRLRRGVAKGIQVYFGLASDRTLTRTALLLLLAAALLGAPRPAAAQARAAAAQARTAVAIVVHPQTRVSELSFDELRKIFRGDQQFWPDGSRITLLVRAPVAVERALVLDRIYRMTEDQFRQYWIGKMFRADVAAGPKIVYSSEMARELVSAIPGAITFVPADAVVSGLKVLRINGMLPGDATYPLR
jgi:ABC-type phosphate transport system substrate-binding protein